GGVAAGSAVVWVRRRRWYMPRPITGTDPGDADLAPLPETAQAITAGWLEQTAADADADTPAATATPDPRVTYEPAAGPGPAAQAAVGQVPAGPLRPADLPAGGVGLVGAGAGDAARGILAAVLLADSSYAGGARVVTTSADLAGLLDADPPGHANLAGYAGLPGLSV